MSHNLVVMLLICDFILNLLDFKPFLHPKTFTLKSADRTCNFKEYMLQYINS